MDSGVDPGIVSSRLAALTQIADEVDAALYHFAIC